MRQQDDALLFVGVGARDEGDASFGRAGVVGQVGHVGRNVDEIARIDLHVLLKIFSVPHAGDSAERVDCGFVGRVFVCFGSAVGRDGDELHMKGARADRLGRDGG